MPQEYKTTDIGEEKCTIPFFRFAAMSRPYCRTVSEAAQKNDRLPYLLRNDDLVSIRELLLVLLLYDNHNLVISFRQLEALDLRWSKVMKAAQ